MIHSEAVKLLGQIQAYDRRTVGDVDVIAWRAALHDIELADASDALLEHVRTQPGVWVEVGHIRQGVKRIRDRKLAAVPDPLPSTDPDDMEAYRREQLALRRAIADGPQQGTPKLGIEHNVTTFRSRRDVAREGAKAELARVLAEVRKRRAAKGEPPVDAPGKSI